MFAPLLFTPARWPPLETARQASGFAAAVHTMPPRDQTGIPHFHSPTILGSALRMIARTFASIFPRQSASELTLAATYSVANSAATGLFISSPISRN